ncbi:MAG: hypothetical protein GKR97_20355 [Rhizobiaceae bacterium]|nr:hypothetical protein [Rhizobiaceae bacterium]
MSNVKVISALVLSIAILSAQSPAQASLNPTAPEGVILQSNTNLIPLDIVGGIKTSTATASQGETIQVSWSIKGAYKKAKRGVKKAGRATGRGIRKANRVVMPSEIRNGASKAYRVTKRKVKHVIAHPYGKRCKPNKYLQPVCSVKGKRQSVNIHDHRN